MILSIVSLVVSLLSLVLSFRKHDRRRHLSKLEARAELGRKYAAMAVAQCGTLTAQLDAFRIIDTSLDGKRDFTEAQARVFIEATK